MTGYQHLPADIAYGTCVYPPAIATIHNPTIHNVEPLWGPPPIYTHVPQPMQPIPSVPTNMHPPTAPKTTPIKPEQKTTLPVQQTVQQPQQPAVRENLITGAANVASSALNTAKSVLQMIAPTKTEEVMLFNISVNVK